MNIQLTINDWCELFAEQASMGPHVFWVRSLDYKQQVFLSNSFETVWGTPTELLYNNPDAFDDFIVSDNRDKLAQNYVKRHQQFSTDASIYRIKSPTGKQRYIRDRFMTLTNAQGQPFAAAGVAMDITHKMDISPEEHEECYASCAEILKGKLNLLTQKELHDTVKLSKREKQCGQYLVQGKTAQQTAERLFLSRRTVEKHLDSLRAKLNCTTKLDLLKFLIETNYDLST